MCHVRDAYAWLACFFLFLCGSTLPAQTHNPPVQLLQLGVQDRKGQFVIDIQSEQIVIAGQTATVQRIEADNSPRRILLLLDTSGSIGGSKSLSWSNVAQFAIRFALLRKGEDSIGLDTFGEKDEVHVSLTTDSQSLVSHIEALTNSGKGRTMLGLALNEILARKEGGLRSGDAIILVSDGDRSDADKTDFTRLRDDLIRSGIRICLVRVPPSMAPGATRGVRDVGGFIKETGGMEFNTINPLNEGQQLFAGVRVDPDVLESTAQVAYIFSQAFYRLTLKFSRLEQKPRQLRLEIVDKRKEAIKGLKLSYPRYLLTNPVKQ